MTAAARQTLDWATLGTGLVSLSALLFLHRWGTAASVGLIVAMHLQILVKRWHR